MKKSFILWSLALILVAGALYTTNSYTNSKVSESVQAEEAAQKKPNAAENSLQQAIPFLLKDLEGNAVALEDFEGKKVFLNFWATWCPPCRAEMPDLQKLYWETKESDLVIVTINVQEKKSTIEKYMKDVAAQNFWQKFSTLLSKTQCIN